MKHFLFIGMALLVVSCSPVETRRNTLIDDWRKQQVNQAKEALAAAENRYGEDHPSVAKALDRLAGLHSRQSKVTEAETLYKRSLAIKEKAYGKDHPDVATSLDHLAKLHQDQGRYTEAEAFFRRSLSIIESALGGDHPRVARVLENLAKCSEEMGKNDEAKKFKTRAKEIMSKVEANAYKLSEVDKPPRIIRKIEPLYPFAAKRFNVQGRVTLRFIVTREGRVVLPRVVKGEPPGVFDNSALKAILRWRFRPASKDDKAVDVIIIAPLKFELIK